MKAITTPWAAVQRLEASRLDQAAPMSNRIGSTLVQQKRAHCSSVGQRAHCSSVGSPPRPQRDLFEDDRCAEAMGRDARLARLRPARK
jgi:hypothetical protein